MNQDERISDLAIRRRKMIVDQIRIYHDQFEYRLLPDYEVKIDGDKTHCIELGNVFIQLMINKDHAVLLSVLFAKDKNSIDSIVDWVQKHRVELFVKGARSLEIKNIGKVIDVVTFYGQPLVLYTKGENQISIDVEDLIEVTESFEKFHALSNTADYLPVLDHHDKDEFGLVGSDYQFDELDKDDALGDYPGNEE